MVREERESCSSHRGRPQGRDAGCGPWHRGMGLEKERQADSRPHTRSREAAWRIRDLRRRGKDDRREGHRKSIVRTHHRQRRRRGRLIQHDMGGSILRMVQGQAADRARSDRQRTCRTPPRVELRKITDLFDRNPADNVPSAIPLAKPEDAEIVNLNTGDLSEYNVVR